MESILRQPDIKAALTAVVLSANDPVAAWGGVKLLRERFGIEPCVVTGPATDNQVGIEIIREQMNVEAFNAISHPADLGDHIIASLGLRNVRRVQGSRRMSAATPAIVLGGTGYVAGELLRLIAGHPQLKVAAILSDSQPGAPVAGRVRAFAQRLSGSQIRRCPRKSKAIIRRDAGVGAVFRRAARRFRRHRRPAAGEAAAARARACIAWIFPRTFAMPARPPTKRCTSMRTARRREFANSPVRCPSICRNRRRRMSRIPAVLRPPRCSPACRCWRWA